MNRRLFLASAAAASAAGKDQPVRLGVIGVGHRGTSLLRVCLTIPGVAVTAVNDLEETKVARAVDYVQGAGQAKPAIFAGDARAYLRLLDRNDVDAVLIGTPEPLHAPMAVDALLAGKHVLSEVAAATTLADCWRLVRTVEQTRRVYMMAENCCYYRTNLLVGNLVRAGLFGELTYGECGYVHEVRRLFFTPDGKLTWRGELSSWRANWYPTHALGPVAQWMGIHRGDRLDAIVSMATSSASMDAYVARQFPPDSPARGRRFGGDSITSLIRTAKQRVIEIRFDVSSPRPHPSTTYFTLQGTAGSYRDAEGEQRIWIEQRSPRYAWEPLTPYAAEFDHELWRRHAAEAGKTGHGGSDYLMLRDFFEAVRSGRPSPVDVYDAAAWSAVIPLSEASVQAGGAPQAFPDFTSGKWRG